MWMNSTRGIHSDFPASTGIFQMMARRGDDEQRPKRPNRIFAPCLLSSRVVGRPTSGEGLQDPSVTACQGVHIAVRVVSPGLLARTDAGRSTAAAPARPRATLHKCATLRNLCWFLPRPPLISHEEDLPTKSSSQKASPRFPRKDAHPCRTRHHQEPARQRPEASRCLSALSRKSCTEFRWP